MVEMKKMFEALLRVLAKKWPNNTLISMHKKGIYWSHFAGCKNTIINVTADKRIKKCK